MKDNLDVWARTYDPRNRKLVPNQKRFLGPGLIVGLLVLGPLVVFPFLLNRKEEPKPLLEPAQVEEINAITALGRIEPQGEVIRLGPPPNLGGSKVDELLVQEGDLVEKNQVIALLDNYKLQRAALIKAEREVEVEQANLAIVKAGPKEGEVEAQKATIERLKKELDSEIASNKAKIARLEAERTGEQKALQATLERLKAELNNASLEFQRYQQLASQGAISSSELDSYRLSLATAQEKVTEAEANLNKMLATNKQEILETQALANKEEASLKQQILEAEATLAKIMEVRDVDVKEAQARVETAIANYQEAKEYFELTHVRAPFRGRILKIHTHPGEMISSEQGIIDLAQTEQMVVVAEVHESDIGKVRLGQKVLVTSESGTFTDELQGTVNQIGWQIGKKDVLDTDPAADVDSRVVEVRVLLEPEASAVVESLTYSKVYVKILLEE